MSSTTARADSQWVPNSIAPAAYWDCHLGLGAYAGIPRAERLLIARLILDDWASREHTP